MFVIHKLPKKINTCDFILLILTEFKPLLEYELSYKLIYSLALVEYFTNSPFYNKSSSADIIVI